ncbi:MAG: hypothetical protein WAK27_12220 [Candidatus Sulfotelmatobacter sp.]|jgi:hypothetical protein
MQGAQAVAFATRFTSTKYSQSRETKNRAYGLLREDHYTPEYVPNGVRLEKPVAPPLA